MAGYLSEWWEKKQVITCNVINLLKKSRNPFLSYALTSAENLSFWVLLFEAD